jgi:hypothetical protein
VRTGQLMVIGWSGSGQFMNETSQDTVKILLKYRTSPANVYWKHSDYKHKLLIHEPNILVKRTRNITVGFMVFDYQV